MITERYKDFVLKLASKEVGVEANPEKTKYLLRSRSQKTGQNHSTTRQSPAWTDTEETNTGLSEGQFLSLLTLLTAVPNSVQPQLHTQEATIWLV
jgi:hypothetical protein